MNGFDVSEQTHLANVDLDVTSRRPLGPLAAAFGQRVVILYVGGERRHYAAHFELRESYKPSRNADALIRRFVELIRKLPDDARQLWDNARSREFNIGIECGMVPHSHEMRLRSTTLEAVATVGGSIVITTYAPDVTPKAGVESRSKVNRRRC